MAGNQTHDQKSQDWCSNYYTTEPPDNNWLSNKSVQTTNDKNDNDERVITHLYMK